MDEYDTVVAKCLGYINEKLLPICNSIDEPLEGNFFTHMDLFKNKQKNLVLISKKCNKALEIGFNAGFSSLLILLSNSEINLTCVDICVHKYSLPCYNQLKADFGDRINLIPGDSEKIIPTIHDKFDLIHIDGGHTVEIANKDILNTHRLTNPGTIVIMDDVVLTDRNCELTNAWLRKCSELSYKNVDFPIFPLSYQDVRFVTTVYDIN